MPVGMAAGKRKVPVILHESNAFPGVAVKMLSNRAEKVLLGFEDAKERLTKAKALVVTGTPTKVKKILMPESKKASILKQNGLNQNKPIVLVFGGSQGAQSINKSFLQIIGTKTNKGYQIMWAAGPAQYEEIKKALKEQYQLAIEQLENAKIVPYIYNMEEMLNVVDLVVARSGAMTITEIANVGKPAIFIPFPFATENHQEYNAKVLEKVGAAKIILDKELTAEKLNTEICDIIKEPSKMLEMGKKANSVAIINVEQKIYQEMKEVLKNRTIK